MPKIKMYLSIGLVGCRQEDEMHYPDKEWNKLTEEQQENELLEIANTHMENYANYGAYVEDDEND